MGCAVAEWLAKGARVKACQVITRAPSGQGFEVAGTYGLSPSYVEQADEKEDAITLAAFQGRLVEIDDLGNDARVPYHQQAQQEGIVSLVAVPMVVEHSVIGVARFYTNTPRRFTRRDLDCLAAQAHLAALALENARLYHRSRILFEVAQSVSSTLELRQAANVIAEAATRAAGAKGCSVRMLGPERRLDLVGAYGLSREYLEKGPINADVSIAEALAGHPVAILDAAHDPRLQYPEAASAEGIASVASIPMILKGVVTGVLRVYTAITHSFAPDEIELLMALACVGAAALENARLYDGIRQDFQILMDEIVYMRHAARAKSWKETL